MPLNMSAVHSQVLVWLIPSNVWAVDLLTQYSDDADEENEVNLRIRYGHIWVKGYRNFQNEPKKSQLKWICQTCCYFFKTGCWDTFFVGLLSHAQWNWVQWLSFQRKSRWAVLLLTNDKNGCFQPKCMASCDISGMASWDISKRLSFWRTRNDQNYAQEMFGLFWEFTHIFGPRLWQRKEAIWMEWKKIWEDASILIWPRLLRPVLQSQVLNMNKWQ